MTRNFRPIRTGLERMSALMAGASLMVSSALASDGAALPGQMGLQTPVTTVGHDINFFHNSILLPIITVVTIFVLILLIFAADALWLHWNLPVLIGREFVGFVEYLSFWR